MHAPVKRRWTASRAMPAVLALVASAVLASPSRAYADCSPRPRYDAAAKYASCVLSEIGKFIAGSGDVFYRNVSKCRGKYADTWERRLAPICGSRFAVGGGIIYDQLTELEWEQKTSDGSIHDVDDRYLWSEGDGLGQMADGPVFTEFLAVLNTPPCFAGHCDWRLPTLLELQTILSEQYPCASDPCVDLDAFAPTASDISWASTSLVTSSFYAWGVDFRTGALVSGNNKSFLPRAVRAVRGGL